MLITRPWALYNEIDEYAADWLESLIRLGVIAPGIVDRRSIADLRGDDLREFRQCHFFAGIGVWSYSLRRAGVSDDTALWTGSCPCQPFSAAGKGVGVDDERHLWPAFFHLIEAQRQPRIYGEQVASKDGLGWLDLVQADLEGSDYSIWAVDTCSAGSGAPHIRQRLRFFAYDLRSTAGGLEHSRDDRSQGRLPGREDAQRGTLDRSSGRDSAVDRLASGDDHDGRSDLSQRRPEERATDWRGSAALWLADSEGARRADGSTQRGSSGSFSQSSGEIERVGDRRSSDRMADADGWNPGAEGLQRSGEQRQQPQDGGGVDRMGDNERIGRAGLQRESGARMDRGGDQEWSQFGFGFSREVGPLDSGQPRPTNGFCRDGKWRPVEPGTFPLVDGSSFHLGSGSAFEGKSRQGLLRAYGNAVDAEATTDFIEATLELDTIDAVRGGADDACQSPLELYTRSRRDTEDLA